MIIFLCDFPQLWYLLIWCLSLPALRVLLACQGGISASFPVWRGESWRPCSYLWKSLCSVSRLIGSVLSDPWNQAPSFLPLNSPSECKLWDFQISCIWCILIVSSCEFSCYSGKISFNPVFCTLLTQINTCFSCLPALHLDTSRVKKFQFDFLTFAICSCELWSSFCFPTSAFTLDLYVPSVPQVRNFTIVWVWFELSHISASLLLGNPFS